ncbi:hypothetical protein [Thermus sp.]|uniref:hypothetical protein n=1 Tax=Thermus sp. TaxID=275 RepID=UPI0028CC6947|nr:hypothetical protein [Thermus sp.]MDT7909921.1 hypothetical protein [Thermus sp.]MDT7922684.1 hypothetical protein [Thermus sp.]
MRALLRLFQRTRRPGPCPVCGLPRPLAEEVRRYRRFCPHVAFRACPFDPRKGLYRLRR